MFSRIPEAQHEATPTLLVRQVAAAKLKEVVSRLVIGKVWQASVRWRFSRMCRVLEKVWNRACQILD